MGRNWDVDKPTKEEKERILKVLRDNIIPILKEKEEEGKIYRTVR